VVCQKKQPVRVRRHGGLYCTGVDGGKCDRSRAMRWKGDVVQKPEGSKTGVERLVKMTMWTTKTRVSSGKDKDG